VSLFDQSPGVGHHLSDETEQTHLPGERQQSNRGYQ
jgi:hypothetical protein